MMFRFTLAMTVNTYDYTIPQLALFPFGEGLVANFSFLERSNPCGAHGLSRKLTTSLLQLWLLELTVHEDDVDEQYY